MKVIQKKICMLGSFAVGKTSLVKRFVDGRFDDRYLSTIGVKISRKTVDLTTLRANLIVWDLAGGDEFIRSNVAYLRGASGAVVVCDLTRPQTLSAAESYAHSMRARNESAGLVFIGNKVDLIEERAVSEETIAELAGMFSGAHYFLTSAKTGLNVENAFLKLANLVVSNE